MDDDFMCDEDEDYDLVSGLERTDPHQIIVVFTSVKHQVQCMKSIKLFYKSNRHSSG